LIRTRLAIVGAALAATTLLSTTAEACISCNYTPSYGGSGATKAAPARTERSYTRTEERRRIHTAKKRAIEQDDTAEASEAAKEVETAATPPSTAAKPQAETEPSSITPGASQPAAKTATATESAPAKPQAVIENSSISTATLDASNTATTTPTATKESDPGCKKFFPAIGMTLSVPCD
jgi:hypothetical protein